MATLARWQATIVDNSGNTLAAAEITVKIASTGALAVLYSARDGLSGLTNPFNADSEGFAAFYAPGDEYQITAVSGLNSITWDYVAIGLAAAHDTGLVTTNLITVDDADLRYLHIANNLAEVTPSTARFNLGLGTAALADTGTGASNVPTIAQTDLRYLSLANNLAEVTPSTARFNLGLGTLAVLNSGPGGVDVSDNTAGDLRWSALAGNSALVTLGSVAAGVWQATKIAEVFGGTNQNSYTLGDTLYSSAANTLSKLPGNTTAALQVLSQTGNGTISAAPAWHTLSSAELSDVTSANFTPVDNSGAGLALTVNHAKYSRIGNTVFLSVSVTYPATANTAVASIAGFPLTSSASGINCSLVFKGLAATDSLSKTGAVTSADFFNGVTAVQNVALSGARIVFTAIYFT